MTVEIATAQRPTLFLNELTADDAAWFLGAETWVRATSEQTSGALGLVEHILEPGFASPYHLHHNEDEAFYVLEGQLRFVSEGRSWVVGAGGFAFLPREIPHGFRVEGDTTARCLLLVTPGGFEGFVAELSQPEPPTIPPDLGHLVEVAARYAIDILGPLPE
jgi:quercetin dioxygenase-like cupin family protein